MMRANFDRVTRRRVAVAVVVAYAVPLFVGLAKSTLHAGEHIAQLLTVEKERLTTLGLVHGFAEVTTGHDTSARDRLHESAVEKAGEVGGYVHEHGGVPHSHGGMIGEAMAGHWTENGEQPEASVAPALAFHLPPADQAATLSTGPLLDPVDPEAQPTITDAHLPPLRPPRA